MAEQEMRAPGENAVRHLGERALLEQTWLVPVRGGQAGAMATVFALGDGKALVLL